MAADRRPDADTVAGIVRAVSGVIGLHAGMFGEVATYLPGRRVPGVRIGDDRVDIHVVVSTAAPVRETAAAVRDAVAAARPGTTVDVTVEDVDVGPRQTAAPARHPNPKIDKGGST